MKSAVFISYVPLLKALECVIVVEVANELYNKPRD